MLNLVNYKVSKIVQVTARRPPSPGTGTRRTRPMVEKHCSRIYYNTSNVIYLKFHFATFVICWGWFYNVALILNNYLHVFSGNLRWQSSLVCQVLQQKTYSDALHQWFPKSSARLDEVVRESQYINGRNNLCWNVEVSHARTSDFKKIINNMKFEH